MNKQQKQNAFLSKVNQTENCWEWCGTKNPAGYGIIQTDWAKEMKTQYAHRISYMLFKGDLNGLDILHSCDNPKCVNPSHLRLGTQAENNKDRDEKGRHKALSGLEHGSSIFNKQQIDDIRKMRSEGIYYKDIAEKYNCNRRTIERICLNKTYK